MFSSGPILMNAGRQLLTGRNSDYYVKCGALHIKIENILADFHIFKHIFSRCVKSEL